MASFRFTYSPTTPMGSKLFRLAQAGAQFRQAVLEFHNECEAYNDNNAQLESDLGATTGTAAALRTQLNESQAELFGTALAQVSVGGQTVTRQLLDQCS